VHQAPTLQLPGEGVFLLILNAVILVGWIITLARTRPLGNYIAMLAATAGIWFIGLGWAMFRLQDVSLQISQNDINDSAGFSEHLGNTLIMSALATQAVLGLTVLAIIAFFIRSQGQKAELAS
jgi:hypothetical protein